MRKRMVSIIIVAVLAVVLLSGCGSLQRFRNDLKSDLHNGLERTITVYTANGDKIAEYEGKIDLASNEGGYVKFDYNGKRYIYYNCFVESIADID